MSKSENIIAKDMIIMKFGGTSMGSAYAIEQVIDIFTKKRAQTIGIVVSAFSRCTDQLVEMANKAISHKSYKKLLADFSKRHLLLSDELIAKSKLKLTTRRKIESILGELEYELGDLGNKQELSEKDLDSVMSFGERLSAFILSQILCSRGIKALYVDSRTVVKTNEQYGNAKVNFKATNHNIQHLIQKLRTGKSYTATPIFTGFIGSTTNNKTTTLGRGGSDYTASIIGAALQVKSIEIWTDVDGVMTADPRKVKSAFSIKRMSYEEAMEMSHFGAKVIYPPTMVPARNINIPIVIKNTFNQDFLGTRISLRSFKEYPVCGISSISQVAILLFQGNAMVGVPGIAS